MTARHLKQMYLPTAAAFSFSLHELHRARPAFLKKPLSVSTSWHSSHLKQPGCQLEFIALMTRPVGGVTRLGGKACILFHRTKASPYLPMMNSLHLTQQGAKRT